MKVVHIQTQVSAVFGFLDDNGNATPQEPVVVRINHFAPEAFAEAYATLAGARDKAAGQTNGATSPLKGAVHD